MPITTNVVVPDLTEKPKAKNPFKVDPGLYYVMLVDVNEAEVRNEEMSKKFGPSWVWKFVVLDSSLKVVTMTTEEGKVFPHVFIQFTSDKLGINFKSKEPARARRFLEGLLREKLETGANGQALVNKALSTHSVAQALITQDNKKPEYMTIGQMLPVNDAEVYARVAEAVKAATPEPEEVPF